MSDFAKFDEEITKLTTQDNFQDAYKFQTLKTAYFVNLMATPPEHIK